MLVVSVCVRPHDDRACVTTLRSISANMLSNSLDRSDPYCITEFMSVLIA
jgi:hypothetical protein